ncbi:uncharacterized protein [Pagrus major]|uniref:uncharacterized protein isoform X2 n=1 Tax=Pagrus major TaxID=143350 RepID=UPI003CC8C12A
MHLKQKGYCFGVLLIYTITTITLPSVGWCEPISPSKPSSHLALHNERSSVLTTRGLTRLSERGGGRKRLQLDSRQGGESGLRPHLDNREGTQTKTSGGRPARTLGPKMASSSSSNSFKNRDKPKETKGERMFTSPNPTKDVCSGGKIKPVIHGKFYIPGELAANVPNVGYQSDSAVSAGQERTRGQRVSASEDSWQRLQPVVECGDDAMTLTVRRRRAVQLLLDRVNESSLPLSQLPPHCGYSVQTTWRDLSFMAPYDACHVTQEDDSYVLPLWWRGSPVKISCPTSHLQPQASPPSLCCSQYGMTIKVQRLSTTEELRVNVRGEWTPVVVLAEQCGYTLDRRDAEMVIAAPFMTCGITVKDEKYTLVLQMGDKTFTLACPVSPLELLPLTHQPLVRSPHHPTRVPTAHVPESLEPVPWAPPFYLAPPYYPHPTYHRKYTSPDGYDSYDPPNPSSTPEPTFGPQPLPTDDSQQGYQHDYSHQIPVGEYYKHFGVHSSLSSTDHLEDSSEAFPDLQQKQETPVFGLSDRRSATHSPSSDTDSPIHAEAPPLQPPSHAFNQYYHYYHHPKIPLHVARQDRDIGPEVSSITNPQNPEFPVLTPSIQQSEALSIFNSDELHQPVPEATSHPYTPPTTTPYPSQPYPYHYFYYFPHIARGEAKRSAPFNPDSPAEMDIKVRPHPRSSAVHDESNLHPHTHQRNPDKMIDLKKNSPEWIKHPLLSDEDGVKDMLEPPGPASVRVPSPEQPSFPSPSPNHNLPPHLYHPYYHFYQTYYGPERLHSANNHVSPASFKEALDPQHQASSSPPQPQTTTPPTKSVDDDHQVPLHSYYYYYQLSNQPQVSVDRQEVQPAGSMNSKSASDYSQTGWLAPAAEAGYRIMPQSRPFHSIYSHDITQHHPYDPFGHPDGEGAEERLDGEIKDQLKANPYTPSASPCGLGPVSDFDCIVSSGCCSYPVEDCTMGQHLIFAVPDSVVEPTVAPPAHPSEISDVSCTLQRLTSDPDIYIVPLDGCGVNKHVFGQTVVHQLEVNGIHSLQQDHSSVHENSPVRLMVECSSSLGSPGEVRVHVMDQPPPPPFQSTPATVTVQLRVATDESFTSFHPEAHLPLAVLRGRPVYVEVSLLDPPEPGLVLLVHSCLAYTQAPYTSWMLVYDGCPSHSDSQLLPSPHPNHIRRIVISSLQSLHSQNHTYMANGRYSHLEDTEIFFSCSTEVCSAADGDCTVGCINSPNSDVLPMK